MKTVKKVLCVILALTLLLSISALVSAAEDKVDTVKMKHELIGKAPKPTITDEKEKDKFAAAVSNEFSSLYSKEGYNQEAFDKFFASKGYIKFDVKKASKSGIESLFSWFTSDAYASAASNVTMSTPSVYYNTSTARWTVVGGGYWQSLLLWAPDMPSFGGAVGGPDLAGLYFSNLIANGTQVPITKQELYARNVCTSTTLVSTTRYNQDSSHGAFMQYADWCENHSAKTGCNNSLCYTMDGFAVLVELGSTFTNVDGVVSSGYEHTWNGVSITNFQFGSSGWSATLSNNNYGWPGASSDTTY